MCVGIRTIPVGAMEVVGLPFESLKVGEAVGVRDGESVSVSFVVFEGL